MFSLTNVTADLEPFDPGPGRGAPGGFGGRGGGGRGGTFLQGTIPMIKPPYDRITAYDMNTDDKATGADVGAVEMPAQPMRART